MKITEFPSVTELKETNMFLLDGPNGTKIIYAPDLAKELLKLGGTDSIVGNINLGDIVDTDPSDITYPYNYLMIGDYSSGTGVNKSILLNEVLYYLVDSKAGGYDVIVPLKRVLFRGRNLGSVFTDEQKAAIADGSFKGLFLGDYWSIGGRIWRIVDFDYWWGKGDENTQTHHLIIMPDKMLFTAKMNDTDTTNGGYVGSKMSSEGLATAGTIIKGAFGDGCMLGHRELKSNAVTNGRPSSVAWVNSTLDIPNELMIFGTRNMSPMGNGSNPAYNQTASMVQLALFQTHPRFINRHRENYWLRDVASATNFLAAAYHGSSGDAGASSQYGVRPVFGLIG